MIIALVFWLASLLGGGSVQPFALPIKQATEQVKAQVADADRKAKAVAILQKMDETEKAWTKAQKPQIERLQDLIKDRASAPAEFEKVFNDTKSQATAVRAQLLGLRFELKDQLTETEWKAVFAVPATNK